MNETLCLHVRPHPRGDVMPAVCAKARGHEGRHKSLQFAFVMCGPTEPYEWD